MESRACRNPQGRSRQRRGLAGSDFTDSLPREPNDKLRMHLLRERYWAGHNSLVI
jgi:hypothetical protein